MKEKISNNVALQHFEGKDIEKMNIEDCTLVYKEVFDGTPWYGAALLPSLEKIPVQYWDQKVKGSAHSITELVYHIIDWQQFTVEKIKNNITFNIELNSEKDWRKNVAIPTIVAKQHLLQKLRSIQEELLYLLETKSDDWLYEHISGLDYTNEYMIKGTIQHNIYHLGQIRLLYQMLKTNEKI